MGVGQILDGAFTIYRRHFGVVVGVMVVMYGPVLIAFAGLFGWALFYVPESPDLGAAVWTGLLLFLLLVLALVAYVAAEGGITQAVSDLLLAGRTSVRSACGAGLRRLLPLVGGGILRTLAIAGVSLLGLAAAVPVVLAGTLAGASEAAIGFLGGVFGVLGVAMGMSIGLAMLFAVTPVIMLEHLGPAQALVRSSRLARKRWVRILAVLGVALLIGMVLAGGGLLLFSLLVPNALLTQVFQQVIWIVFAPYYAICVVLLYYDARVRSEGFDLEMMAGQLRPEGGAA